MRKHVMLPYETTTEKLLVSMEHSLVVRAGVFEIPRLYYFRSFTSMNTAVIWRSCQVGWIVMDGWFLRKKVLAHSIAIQKPIYFVSFKSFFETSGRRMGCQRYVVDVVGKQLLYSKKYYRRDTNEWRIREYICETKICDVLQSLLIASDRLGLYRH